MTTTWTDDPIIDGSQPNPTQVRKIHVDELRTSLNNDIAKRGGVPGTWEDPTITAGTTKIRSVHLNELRSATDDLYAILIAPCASNTVPVPSYTVPEPMTDTTDASKVRATHIEELRYIINDIEAQCLCDCDGHCSCVSHSHCSCAGMAHCCCESHGMG